MPDPLETLRAVIAAATTFDQPFEPATLLDDLGLDGLDRQCIAMELENRLDIRICDTTLEQWRTIADVIATMETTTA